MSLPAQVLKSSYTGAPVKSTLPLLTELIEFRSCESTVATAALVVLVAATGVAWLVFRVVSLVAVLSAGADWLASLVAVLVVSDRWLVLVADSEVTVDSLAAVLVEVDTEVDCETEVDWELLSDSDLTCELLSDSVFNSEVLVTTDFSEIVFVVLPWLTRVEAWLSLVDWAVTFCSVACVVSAWATCVLTTAPPKTVPAVTAVRKAFFLASFSLSMLSFVAALFNSILFTWTDLSATSSLATRNKPILDSKAWTQCLPALYILTRVLRSVSL